MTKKKNKRISFEKQLCKIFNSYKPHQRIKDIENNTKHKPKGQRWYEKENPVWKFLEYYK